MEESHVRLIVRLHELIEMLQPDIEGAEVKKLLDEISGMLGFEHYTYVGGLVFAGQKMLGWNPGQRPISITNIKDEFYQEYSGNRLDRYDPILKYSMGTISPGLWSKIYDLAPKGKSEKEFVSLSFDFGMRQGIAFPVHGPGNDFGILSFAHSKDDCCPNLAQGVLGTLSIFVQRLHIHMREKYGEPAPEQAVHLSPREIDALYWTAEGKSAWEIAAILEISQRTVEEYLNSARRKLGATTKFAAVAKLMSIRFKEPF